MPKSIETHILIVGSGIIGCALAYALTREHTRVTMVHDPHYPHPATPASFGWINANWHNAETYARLRRYAASVWHRWQEQLPKLPVQWPGAISWGFPETAMQEYVDRSNAAGWTARLLDADEIRRAEPGIVDPPPRAVLAECEGYINGRVVRDVLLSHLHEQPRFSYRELRLGTMDELDQLMQEHRSDGGVADRVVIATGADTGRLLGLPVHGSPGLLAASQPLPHRILRHIVSTPSLEILQDAHNRIQCVPVDNLPHAPTDDPPAVAAIAIARARELLGIADIELDGWAVGNRPMPADKLPVLGPVVPASQSAVPIYVVAMHSGATLAPGIAELVTAELLELDSERELRCELDRYHPSRLSPT